MSVHRQRDVGFERLGAEDPGTPLLEDIEHWIAVYRELLAGASRLRQDAPGGDERLGDELGRMRERLRYWTDRRRQLLGERETA